LAGAVLQICCAAGAEKSWRHGLGKAVGFRLFAQKRASSEENFMTRKCQHCGHLVAEAKAILCPSCDTLLGNGEETPAGLTHEQEVKICEAVSERLLNNRRFRMQIVKSLLFWILGAVGLLGIFFSFSIWDSLQGLTATTNKRLAVADLQTSNQIASTEERIRASILQQFNDPRIKVIMADVAATQASNLLVQQISPDIEKFRTGTSNTLAGFNDSLQAFQTQATNELANVREANEFTLLIAEAFGDNFGAFEKLTQIQNDLNSPFREIAGKTVSSVITRYATEPATFENMTYPFEFDPATNSLEQLKSYYITTGFVPAKIFLLKNIYTQDRFPKADRIGFAIKVLSSDPSISLRNYACFLVNKEAKLGCVLDGISRYIVWWNDSKSKYSNISTNHP
jgi:hypothetical protein